MGGSLHVGMVSCYFPPSIGGVQTHVTEISRNLESRGYEITGFTSETRTAEIDKWMHVVRVAPPRTLKRTIPLPRPIRTVRVARLARRLSRECDVVHVHSSKRFFSVITELVSRLCSTPVVLTLHGGGAIDRPELLPHRRAIRNVTRQSLLRLANVVVSTCPHFTDIATRYVSRSKIRSIPNGVSADFFTPGGVDRAELDVLADLDADANILLSMNMIKPVKGMRYVAQALPEVLASHPDTHYLIVGDGDWKEKIREVAEENDVGEHVHFAGAIFDKEIVRSYLRTADIVLTPSSGESTSISTLEAMATECPVVATPVGGLADLLGDDERGRVAELFPPGSYTRRGPFRLPPEKVSLLAEEIEWVLSNPDAAEAMAADARQHVLDDYAWPVIVDQLERVYAELAHR